MANKFTKAVENRTSEIINAGVAKDQKDNSNTVTDESSIDLSALFEKEDEKKASNKTYYLEQSVIDAVKQNAKKQKVSESKLVNNILKHVLNIRWYITLTNLLDKKKY